MDSDRPPKTEAPVREVARFSAMGVPPGDTGPAQLRALLVEDRPEDAQLVVRELVRAGYAPNWRRVDSEETFVAALGADLDVILADFTLPNFSVDRILELLEARGFDIPVVVVTGSIKEEEAVACIRRGVADYLLKDRLARLGQAVARAIEDRRLRQERRALDRSLRESEARYRTLVTRMPVAVFAFDEAGRVLYANEAVGRILGHRPDEIRGRDLVDLLRPEHLREQLGGDERSLVDSTAETGEGREVVVVAADGTTRTLLATLDRIESGSGDPVTMVLFGVDITGQKRLEDQLRQAQKMEAIGRLAGGVAHDFNNLLTVITGYGQFLRNHLGEDGMLATFAAEILDAAARAGTLTRQLLAFSRRQVLQPKVLDLNVVIADLQKLLARLIGEDIELVTDLQPDLWRVRVDPGQIEQVVVNLAVNARDAMPDGGCLVLRTANVAAAGAHVAHGSAQVSTHPSERVLLTVSDTGCGMDAATREQIFEPFFTTKEAGRGTGLGLATVYGIVAQSGGTVTVESAPGAGSTFSVYLPRTHMDEREPPPQGPKTGPLHGVETILLVEDDTAVRSFARDALKRCGYRVLEARDGEEAIRTAKSHDGRVHLLVTDVVMPKMGGRELARRLRADFPGLSVLYVSGYAALEGEEPHLRDASFLPKPYSIDDLSRSVRKALNG